MTSTNDPATLPEIEHSPQLGRERIKEIVSAYEPDLQRAIAQYLKDDIKLPRFQPQAGSAMVRDHIASLKIPTIPSSPQIPSLLLHNLGQLSHDRGLVNRIKKVFNANSQPT